MCHLDSSLSFHMAQYSIHPENSEFCIGSFTSNLYLIISFVFSLAANIWVLIDSCAQPRKLDKLPGCRLPCICFSEPGIYISEKVLVIFLLGSRTKVQVALQHVTSQPIYSIQNVQHNVWSPYSSHRGPNPSRWYVKIMWAFMYMAIKLLYLYYQTIQ